MEVLMKSTGLRSLLVILLCFIVSFTAEELAKRTDKKSKSVTTIVSAKWEATPIILELAEYLSNENSDMFWSFVEGINNLKTKFEDLETDKQRYEASMSVANSFLTPAQLRLAKLALSLHITSPTVRMFAEIANQNGATEVPCDTFVHIASRHVCDNDELQDILTNYIQYDPNEHKLETYLLDHSYPTSNNKSLTGILYGELGMADFSSKHLILQKYADSGIINYIVRWNNKSKGKQKLRLSGYGVELQLKSTEYKSEDDTTPDFDMDNDATLLEEEDENDPQNQIEGFNFGKLKSLFPALRTPLERFRRHLLDSSEELAPLKVWQMQGLSMQAAAAVIDAHDSGGDEALKVLTSIAQNFPMQTKSLIHVNVPRSFRDEVLYNQDIWSTTFGLRPTESLLFVSGAQYDGEEVDAMALLDSLREDIAPMNMLHALGLPDKLINKLMSLELGDTLTSEDYGLDIRDTAITWINDVENDDRYLRWPSSYMELLRPTYPGMLRNIRRNIYNYVIVIDPTQSSSTAPMKLGETLLKHATPVRVGLVLAPINDNNSTKLILESAIRSTFNYIAQKKNSNREAFYCLSQLYEKTRAEDLTVDHVKKELAKYVSSPADISDVLSEDSGYDYGRQLAHEFVNKIGTDRFPEVLINGIPLYDESSTPGTATVEMLEESLVSALTRHTGRLQRAVFQSHITDMDDAVEFLMKQPHIMPRLNRLVLGSDPSQYLDLSGVASSPKLFTEDKIHKILNLSGRDALATALPVLKYFTKGGKSEKFTNTLWVIGDLKEKYSRALLKSALEFMRESGGVRVAFIPNIDGASNVDQSLNKVVLAALAVLDSSAATKYVRKLLQDEGCHKRKDCDIQMALFVKQDFTPPVLSWKWIAIQCRPNMLLQCRKSVINILESGLMFREDSAFVEQEVPGSEDIWARVGGGRTGWLTSGEQTISTLAFACCLFASPPNLTCRRCMLIRFTIYAGIPVKVRAWHRFLVRSASLNGLTGIMRDYLALTRRTMACLKEYKVFHKDLSSMNTIIESAFVLLWRQQTDLSMLMSRCSSALLGNFPWLHEDVDWHSVWHVSETVPVLDEGDLVRMHHAFLVIQSSLLKHIAMAHFPQTSVIQKDYKNHNERLYWLHSHLLDYLNTEFNEQYTALDRMYRLLKNYGTVDSTAPIFKKTGTILNDSWLYSDVHGGISKAAIELKVALQNCITLDMFLDNSATNRQDIDLSILNKDIEKLLDHISHSLGTVGNTQIRLKKLQSKFNSPKEELANNNENELHIVGATELEKIDDKEPEAKDEFFYFIKTEDDESKEPPADSITSPGKQEREATKVVLNELKRKLVRREDIMREREKQALINTMPEFKNNIPEFPRQNEAIDKYSHNKSIVEKMIIVLKKKLFKTYKIKHRTRKNKLYLFHSKNLHYILVHNHCRNFSDIPGPIYIGHVMSRSMQKLTITVTTNSLKNMFITRWYETKDDNYFSEPDILTDPDSEYNLMSKMLNDGIENNFYSFKNDNKNMSYPKEVEYSQSSSESDLDNFYKERKYIMKDLRKQRNSSNRASSSKDYQGVDESLRPVEYRFGTGMTLASMLQQHNLKIPSMAQEEVYIGDGEVSSDSGNDGDV